MCMERSGLGRRGRGSRLIAREPDAVKRGGLGSGDKRKVKLILLPKAKSLKCVQFLCEDGL